MIPVESTLSLAVALRAALDTGLLLALVEAKRSPAEHATALGLDARATAVVLDVLVTGGIAARDGDAVGASAEVLAWTRVMPIHVEQALALWGHTTEFLKTGRPFLRMDGEDKTHYANVVAGLGRMAAEGARGFAARAPLDPSPRRILDIGCGSGVWSLALAERYRDAHVTGLDRPAVLEAFRARAAEHGLADRIATIAGDVHEVAIPREFDTVVIANVLRIETPDRARRIVERAAGALVPGGAPGQCGTLIVIDALAGGTPDSERARASYALHLAMRTERGGVHAPDTVIGWMTAAGITGCERVAVDSPGAVGAIVGRSRGT